MKKFILVLILMLCFQTLSFAGLTRDQKFVYEDFFSWLTEQDQSGNLEFNYIWWDNLTDRQEVEQLTAYACRNMKPDYAERRDSLNAKIASIEKACLDWGSVC